MELICKKSRGGEVQQHITLEYDPATFTVRTNTERSRMSGEDMVLMHLRRMARTGQPTDFYGTLAETKLSAAALRRVQRELTDRGILSVVNGEGRRRIWSLNDPTVVHTQPNGHST